MPYLGPKEQYLSIEKACIMEALENRNFNITRTAQYFKVDRKTLYTRLRAHGILMGKKSKPLTTTL